MATIVRNPIFYDHERADDVAYDYVIINLLIHGTMNPHNYALSLVMNLVMNCIGMNSVIN